MILQYKLQSKVFLTKCTFIHATVYTVRCDNKLFCGKVKQACLCRLQPCWPVTSAVKRYCWKRTWRLTFFSAIWKMNCTALSAPCLECHMRNSVSTSAMHIQRGSRQPRVRLTSYPLQGLLLQQTPVELRERSLRPLSPARPETAGMKWVTCHPPVPLVSPLTWYNLNRTIHLKVGIRLLEKLHLANWGWQLEALKPGRRLSGTLMRTEMDLNHNSTTKPNRSDCL